jgi:hypothetical protein
MKINIIPDDEFILRNIAEIISTRKSGKKFAYSNTFEFGLTELVRIYMREMAQDSHKDIHNDRSLIDEAYDRATSEIQKRTNIDILTLGLDSVYKNLSKKLRYPAKEISNLKNSLETSKQIERIGKREKLVISETLPFEIIQLGLKDTIEGLLSMPLIKEFEIDLERVKENYAVRGDWFPFEIVIDDVAFVLDDDGTIFTSTENFPEIAFDQAYGAIKELASLIYQS